MREYPEKRRVPANKEQKKAGCFRCGSAEHFMRNCPQPGAAAAKGWVFGWRAQTGAACPSPWRQSKPGLQRAPVLS